MYLYCVEFQRYEPSIVRIINEGQRVRVVIFVVEKGKLKITVLKKTDSKQIFGGDPPIGEPVGVCSILEEGQEFVVGENGDMPKGFCHWAWDDIYKKVITLMFGGNFPWMKEKGTSITCCTDGFRPVIFKLERIE